MLNTPLAPNTYAGNPLDRAGDRRADADWIDARLADPSARAHVLWNGQLLVSHKGGGTHLAALPAGLLTQVPGGEEARLFLGLDEEIPVFAVDLEGSQEEAEAQTRGHGRFDELRTVTPLLSPGDAAVAATARAVFEWRRRHRFCSHCGEPSRVTDAGWRRLCPACSTEHFPRTDPVVIMLPVFGDRCLMGRQASWPAKRFSALAGFLEPGEAIEEACAREVKEECGLTVTAVRYHSSQPWPYPSTLMIGLICEVSSDDAVADQNELEEVRWFTRDQVRAMLAGELEDALEPWPYAIAHRLIVAFAEG